MLNAEVNVEFSLYFSTQHSAFSISKAYLDPRSKTYNLSMHVTTRSSRFPSC